jgi:hypothetical protein
LARSAINIGFPGPNYVTELGNRDAILPGTFEVEQGALSATSSASIGNLTLSATAAAVDSATLAQTIAALTLAATVTGTVTASLSATIANLTLAATATDPGSALLAATIADLTLAATIAVIDQAVLDATIGPITLVATDRDVISAAVDATIGAIILTATGVVVSSGDGVYPWWWAAYVRRHEAEREAARLRWLAEHTIEGDGYFVMRAPTARGQAIHDPDEADMAVLAAASLWLLAA